MPRKGFVERREVAADPVHGNPLVQKFVNCLMHQGEKSVAQKIVYQSLELVRERTKDDPLKVFKKALENVKPTLEVNRNRQSSLSLRWLIGYARQRSEKSMVERLTAELLDAANNRGGAIKKKDDTHRMAEANKAFAHYRW